MQDRPAGSSSRPRRSAGRSRPWRRRERSGCGRSEVVSSRSTWARTRSHATLIERRYLDPLAAGPVRVTQLRLLSADSSATAVLRLLSNRKVQLALNGAFGLVLLAVAFFS